jgi:hypothetical protein
MDYTTLFGGDMNWIGRQVKQIKCEAPEYQKHVGRQGTVVDLIVDEYDEIHIKTAEDGVWCPARLVTVLDSY